MLDPHYSGYLSSIQLIQGSRIVGVAVDDYDHNPSLVVLQPSLSYSANPQTCSVQYWVVSGGEKEVPPEIDVGRLNFVGTARKSGFNNNQFETEEYHVFIVEEAVGYPPGESRPWEKLP